jgi:sec-independent protein translocase protein TatA
VRRTVMMRRPVERKRCLTMFNAMIGKLGVSELLIILLIVLVVLGPSQLPKLSKVLGKTLSSFKKGMDEELEPDGPKDSKHEGSSKKEDSAE